MSKTGKTKIWAIVAIIIIILVVGAGAYYYTLPPAPPKVEKPVNLKMATFSVGTGWYVMGSAISEILKGALPAGSTVDVLPYEGGVGNPKIVDAKKADFGTAFRLTASWAFAGIEAYDRKHDIRTITADLDTYWLAFAIGKDLGITSIEQIKEKKFPLKLTTSSKGGLSEYGASQLLKAHGITYKDIESWGGTVEFLDMAVAGTKLKDRRADAIIWMFTPGHPTATDVFISRDMMFLPVSDAVAEKMGKEYGYVKKAIPAGAFKGVDKAVQVCGDATMLICTPDLDKAVVYAIIKALVENKDKLVTAYKAAAVWDPAAAAKNPPVPLHPGAEAYYKEKGWI